MTQYVLTIHRKKYAAGLFWQPTGSRTVTRSYAAGLALSIDKQLNLYTEYRSMTGLGATRFGHRTGMLSAAAEVVNAMSEYPSFAAMFWVNGVFYLVAVRNGVILEDRVFERIDAARTAYAELLKIPDWAMLIAPGSWGMPRAVERALGDLVTGGARAALRPISRFRARITSVLLFVVFVLFMVWLFREPVQEILKTKPQIAKINPELAAEYKKQIEEKNKELDARYNIQTQEIPKLVMPYDALPNVKERAQTCYQAIAFLMQPVSGWNQTSAECGETSAIATFVRNYGTLGDFYINAGDLMPGALVQEQNDDKLTVEATLPVVSAGMSVDTHDAYTIARDVTTLFQGINTSVETNVVSDTLTNGTETVTIQIIEVAASSKLTPMNFMEIFNDFGGVYMTRCEWNVARRIWNYEVIIYAKPN